MKRIYLNASKDLSQPADETILRAASIALANYAVNADSNYNGRICGDPVFNAVTENLCNAPGMSTCGFLPAYILSRLGCRNQKQVNRGDLGPGWAWVPGLNISKLVYGDKNTFRFYKDGDLPSPGDICYISNPPNSLTDHVFVFEKFADKNENIVDVADPNAYLWSFDYGQEINGKQAGKRRQRKVTLKTNELWLEGRKLMGHLDLTKLSLTETAIVPDDFALGLVDDNPYPENAKINLAIA